MCLTSLRKHEKQQQQEQQQKTNKQTNKTKQYFSYIVAVSLLVE